VTPFGRDLPRPSPDEAVVYLLGPGVGESVVIALPDGRFVLIDVCRSGHTNLPLALLDHLGAGRLDLLVVTHPDLDHVRGLAEVITKRRPHELWRYPLEASIRDFVAAWGKSQGRGQLVADLRVMTDYMHTADGDVSSAAYGNLEWRPSASYTVTALAPTEYDKDRAMRVLHRRLTSAPRELGAWMKRMEVCGAAAAGDAPNVLSVAVVLELGSQRVLFGGDVLRGAPSPKSGWKGVLRLLAKHHRQHLLEDLVGVKVAHHGSRGAFDATVWALHSKTTKTVALVAPFSASRLPDAVTLRDLKRFARRLLVSAPHPQLLELADAAGWSPAPVQVLSESMAPLVGLRLSARGAPAQWFATTTAATFS
jgi:beta-lactamase superfamily II metal-dependent hydrolase